MANKSIYRHEIKFSINHFDKTVLSNRLSSVMKKDKHTQEKGSYTVRSLYFDDIQDSALVEKLTGIKYREKYRIRTYDHSTSLIRLEKKVKNDGVGFKESAVLSLDECKSLFEGEYQFLKQRPEMVCKQLYTKLQTGLFKPKTIVQYEREA